MNAETLVEEFINSDDRNTVGDINNLVKVGGELNQLEAIKEVLKTNIGVFKQRHASFLSTYKQQDQMNALIANGLNTFKTGLSYYQKMKKCTVAFIHVQAALLGKECALSQERSSNANAKAQRINELTERLRKKEEEYNALVQTSQGSDAQKVAEIQKLMEQNAILKKQKNQLFEFLNTSLGVMTEFTLPEN